MRIKPINTKADYCAAWPAIDCPMGSSPGTPESDELEVLRTLVQAYESERWPIEAPDPMSASEHVMEARGFRQKDVADRIGSQPNVSEVLDRRRPLTLSTIRALSGDWALPADVLVREYELVKA